MRPVYLIGGDGDEGLAGIRDRLGYIRGLGTTAIWLTPSFKNKAGQLEDGPSAGYQRLRDRRLHPDRPLLGTDAELAALIQEAHGMGMKLFFGHHHQPHRRRHRLRGGPPPRLRLQGPGALPDRVRHPLSTTATMPAPTASPH